MNETVAFKVGKKTFELYNGKNHFEVYDTENPGNGIVFDEHKDIIPFINGLTDIVESIS